MRNLVLIPVILGLLATALPTASAAQDRRGLEFEAEIDNALLIVTVADLIRKNCDVISARKLKAVMYIKGIERRARKLGYSSDEIEDHVEDDVQKDRLKVVAQSYLGGKGVVSGDPASYCTVGRAEIAGKSTVGSLLTGG